MPWCSRYHGMPHFSWWEHESIPATCESSDLPDLLFLVVLPQPQVVSSHTWEDEYSPRLKDTLCSFLSLSPASCSPSSALWILTILAPSPLIVVTLSQWDCWLFGPPSPRYSLISAPRKDDGAFIVGSTQLTSLLWRIIVLKLLGLPW